MSRETHMKSSTKVKHFGIKHVLIRGKYYWYASITYNSEWRETRIFNCLEETREEAIDSVWQVFKRKLRSQDEIEARECIQTERVFAEIEKQYNS